ncbi:MAG: hypothetical protein AAGA44_11515 [Pseudomonadota bacterium]
MKRLSGLCLALVLFIDLASSQVCMAPDAPSADTDRVVEELPTVEPREKPDSHALFRQPI